MSFETKYLKYKNKYLKLKNQLGGYNKKLESLYYERRDVSMPYELKIGSTIVFMGLLSSDNNPNNIIRDGTVSVYYTFVTDPLAPVNEKIIDITVRLHLHDRIYEFINKNVPIQYMIEHGMLAPYELKTKLRLNYDNTYNEEDANLVLDYEINNLPGQIINGISGKFRIRHE